LAVLEVDPVEFLTGIHSFMTDFFPLIVWMHIKALNMLLVMNECMYVDEKLHG
jgi:hypothetical protein